MVRRFIRRIEPGAVRISSLGAAGTAMLMNKVRSSSRGLDWEPGKRMALTALFLLVSAVVATAAINLSPSEARRIGKRIWQNECNGTVAGLTSWNSGENFASLGIGHFIWYPKGLRGPFEERFPKFVEFAGARHAKLPAVLLAKDACPWNSRAEFYQAAQGPAMK